MGEVLVLACIFTNTLVSTPLSMTIYSITLHVEINTGISPSTSLITDLKAIAGDDSRYLQVSSPEDLYPQFNTLLQNIAVCPDISFEQLAVGKLLL